MCDEHDINIDVETNKKDKQTINQIDGWNIEVKFNENGFSLENFWISKLSRGQGR